METNELLLLGLLCRQHMHGYELHEMLERQLSFLSDLKKSTAYRLLDLLHERGLVERHSERQGRRPERRVYRLTAKGRARFEDLLRSELAAPVYPVDPGNVALLFADQLTPGERVRLLDVRLERVRARREHLAELVARHPPNTSALLVLEHELARADLEVAWLSRAAARIADLDGQTDESGPKEDAC